jgi:hypothetical protein
MLRVHRQPGPGGHQLLGCQLPLQGVPPLHHARGAPRLRRERAANQIKKQDVGHLPFFDQNDLGKYAGFTVLVNSFYTANAEVSGYTTHDGNYGLPQEDANGHDICNEAVTAETTGSALTKATKHHLLTRTACAEHCDDFDSCKGFNFKEYNYNGADTSTTCEFLRVGDIANCTVTNAKTTFYSKIQSQS